MKSLNTRSVRHEAAIVLVQGSANQLSKLVVRADRADLEEILEEALYLNDTWIRIVGEENRHEVGLAGVDGTDPVKAASAQRVIDEQPLLAQRMHEQYAEWRAQAPTLSPVVDWIIRYVHDLNTSTLETAQGREDTVRRINNYMDEAIERFTDEELRTAIVGMWHSITAIAKTYSVSDDLRFYMANKRYHDDIKAYLVDELGSDDVNKLDNRLVQSALAGWWYRANWRQLEELATRTEEINERAKQAVDTMPGVMALEELAADEPCPGCGQHHGARHEPSVVNDPELEKAFSSLIASIDEANGL